MKKKNLYFDDFPKWIFSVLLIIATMHHHHVFTQPVKLNTNKCYRILAIFPLLAPSHYVGYDIILTELARRGHHLTVYSHFPPTNHRSTARSNNNNNFRKYQHVNLRSCWNKNITNEDSVLRLDRAPFAPAFSFIQNMFQLIDTEQEIFACQPFLDLLASKEKYDLLIIEFCITDWVFGYAKQFDVPFVALLSTTVYPWLSYTVGLPENPSHIRYGQATGSSSSSSPAVMMTVFERLENIYNLVLFNLMYTYYRRTRTGLVMEAVFGLDLKSLDVIASETSIILTNSHFSLNTIRSLVPAVVEIGGISIGPLTSLPIDIETFLNESTNGVVYFSMGSVLQSSTFPTEKKNAFLKAFSQLSMDVLWKYELDDLSYKPQNLLISKWVPQRSVLAHPNVKLFISHCGQTSLYEAVNEAVPVLAVPIFHDQFDNALTLVAAGAAEKLNFDEITSEIILDKINKILYDDRYQLNMTRLSDIFKDRPMSPLDTAVFWIEYVARHKGAHHIRLPGIGMSWYHYFFIDVISAVALFILLLCVITYFLLKRGLNLSKFALKLLTFILLKSILIFLSVFLKFMLTILKRFIENIEICIDIINWAKELF